ncbi:major capsid protein [Psychrobacter sp. I-STPA10]|uniref:major capsid protein n=1 Tax=Psychrobacter sp. I-STPA10 TaxID=2585769 RepID=UPI001E594E13|nr:major capsid protein [Psychrobacter sp. I-STPA10]
MSSILYNKPKTDKVLTKVVRGYDLDQEFSGHHLFPDIDVDEFAGKIVMFGKEAYIVINTKRAPGETVRGIGITYSSNDYVLENRLLEALSPEEFIEIGNKNNIAVKAQAVTAVYRAMRLEGEYDKAILANNADHYASTNKTTLSGSSLWNDPTANVLEQVEDAKSTIRAKTGRYPNVFHLDADGFAGLKRNEAIKEQFKYSGKASINTEMLADYFGIEKVVVGRAIRAASLTDDFVDLWADNSILAYVPPKKLQSQASPSFGYNYVHRGFPIVEKEYYDKSDRSWHNPVLFRDKAIITDGGAGFLFINTTG